MNREARDRARGAASTEHCVPLLPAYLNGSLDPLGSTRVARHLARCSDCRERLAAWRAIGEAVELDAVGLTPPPFLLDRVFATIEREEALPRNRITRLTTMLRITRRNFLRPLTAAAAVAAVAVAVAMSPVGGYAQGFLTIFTPKQIEVVPVTTSELQTLPDLKDYGTIVQPQHVQPIKVDSLTAADQRAGYSVVTPSVLPSSVGTPSYDVLPSASGSFTFSAAKAQAAAAKNGKALPAMPANIDGSSIQVTTGTAVVTIYPSTKPTASVAAPAANGKAESTAKPMPALIVGQMPAPTVQSTGVSAQELEQYLLAQPGISPQLAQAIQAIGDPTSTLPIPIPVDKVASHPIQVQGVSGLSMADSTGIGGGIIWEKNGMIYGVAGSYSESQLVSIANSLH